MGRWEAGTRTPSPADGVLLASILGVPFDELFPAVEPGVMAAARRVVAARSVPDLQRAVVGLSEALDDLNEEIAS